jgi:hypothetical protein
VAEDIDDWDKGYGESEKKDSKFNEAVYNFVEDPHQIFFKKQ